MLFQSSKLKARSSLFTNCQGTFHTHDFQQNPGPPSIPRSVTLAKPKNKGKSYTTFLKPIVSAEWLRQIRLKYPQSPLPPSGNVSSRQHAHFLLHHLSLCNNLYKLPPYLTMCAHRNPMSLLRLQPQSHQSIPTHMLNIVDNQRDAYNSRVCLYSTARWE